MAAKEKTKQVAVRFPNSIIKAIAERRKRMKKTIGFEPTLSDVVRVLVAEHINDDC